MIVEDYVSFEAAKLLKEKGFDWECRAFYVKSKECGIELFPAKEPYNYNNNVHPCTSAPTLQMTMKWLREKDWVICILPLTFYCGEKASSWGYNIWANDNLEIDEESTPEFTTYEEACESAIRYCLENLV